MLIQSMGWDELLLQDPFGAIQVLHNAMGWGVWIGINYEGVPSNVNRINMGRGGF